MKRGTLIAFEVPNEAALELELNEGETMDGLNYKTYNTPDTGRIPKLFSTC